MIGRLNKPRLADMMATRVRAIAPEWLTVSVQTVGDETFLDLAIRGRFDSSVLVIADGHTAKSAASLFAWNVLNTVQDVIAIETHEQWPMAAAQPFAILRDGQVMMGYGDENAPALAAEPLSLDDVIELREDRKNDESRAR
jgi:hypothetical protein